MQIIITKIEVKSSRWGYQQEVELILNNGQSIITEKEEIYTKTGIRPNELEVLIGSPVMVTISYKGILSIEKYLLSVSDLTQFRIQGNSKFKEICQVWIEEKYRNSRVYLKTNEGIYNINIESVSIQSCLGKDKLPALVGSFINPDFYEVGEKMGKYICKKTNNTIKDLNLRFSTGFQERINRKSINKAIDASEKQSVENNILDPDAYWNID